MADDFTRDLGRASEQLARALQRVIADGVSWHDAWNLTPRQLSAWIQLSERNRHLNLAYEFINLRLAQAEAKQAQDHLAQLIKGSE